MNKRFIGSQVDNGGNCVVFTILFFHYLFLTKLSPTNGLENLSKLGNDQIIQLINDYSVGINRFIEPLLEEYKKELYSKLYNKYVSNNPDYIQVFKDLIHDKITN